MIDDLPALAQAEPWLARRGRYIDMDFLVQVGASEKLVRVREGRVERVESGPFLGRSWTFAIRGNEEAWRDFWKPVPPPHRQDLMGLVRARLVTIEGNLQPFFANLLWIKALLELPRGKGEAA